jgi:phosphomannomutase
VTEKDGVKYVFGADGWLLHRLSGTEPMVRLYCEHREEDEVTAILAEAEERLRTFAKA